MTQPAAIFRFAPSPNGRLHLGHAYSALLNEMLAAQMHGAFLVRIEDIDITRCTPELTEGCLQDLAWLGLRWPEPVRVQSQHWDDYGAALDRLKAQGLLYPCFCTRRDVADASHGTDPDGAPLYPGTCAMLPSHEVSAKIAKGEPHCWRLHRADAMRTAPGPYSYQRFDARKRELETVTAHPERWGDVVLARKEIPTSYHLSVVVDDALQNITHIVRGKDLEAATDVHVLLQKLLGLPTPLYHHHALLLDPDGDKLAKSKGSQSLQDLRAEGKTPDDIRTMIWRMIPPA